MFSAQHAPTHDTWTCAIHPTRSPTRAHQHAHAFDRLQQCKYTTWNLSVCLHLHVWSKQCFKHPSCHAIGHTCAMDVGSMAHMCHGCGFCGMDGTSVCAISMHCSPSPEHPTLFSLFTRCTRSHVPWMVMPCFFLYVCLCVLCQTCMWHPCLGKTWAQATFRYMCTIGRGVSLMAGTSSKVW